MDVGCSSGHVIRPWECYETLTRFDLVGIGFQTWIPVLTTFLYILIKFLATERSHYVL